MIVAVIRPRREHRELLALFLAAVILPSAGAAFGAAAPSGRVAASARPAAVHAAHAPAAALPVSSLLERLLWKKCGLQIPLRYRCQPGFKVVCIVSPATPVGWHVLKSQRHSPREAMRAVFRNSG